MAEQAKEKLKYRSIIVDTITQLQDDLYMELLENKKKAQFDDWKDFGVEILQFYNYIKNLKDTVLIQVLGYEGTGKSMGASFLDPEETMWLNVDKKPLPFFGWRKHYNPNNKNYAEISSYGELYQFVTNIAGTQGFIKAANKFGNLPRRAKSPLIIFVLGHIDDFTSTEGDKRQRLRTIGKMATKHNVEGSLVHNYYTSIDTTRDASDPERYKLSTHNSGYNTARSPYGYFSDPLIPNNFQLIADKVLEDWGAK